MKTFISVAAAAATTLVLYTPAQAACDKSGHIQSLSIDNAGSATLYLRTSGPASTQVFSFLVTDEKLMDAALAAVPSRARVQVSAPGTAVCSTGVGAPPLATYIFITP